MANLITIARFPVLIAIILLLYAQAPSARVASSVLLVLVIAMDSVDGIIARARDEESLLGSVLDIMVDRSVELVMWVCYAHLGLIPVAIPIIYIVRGTVVDALRSMMVSEGQAPFKGMRTSLGTWLVASPAMRTSYALIKLISFAGLAATHALAGFASSGAVSQTLVDAARALFNITSWVAVAQCLVRGVPVVAEALPILVHSKEPRD